MPGAPHARLCQPLRLLASATHTALLSLTLPLDRGGALRFELKERTNVVAGPGAVLSLHLYAALVHECDEGVRTLLTGTKRTVCILDCWR